ncbi:putative bifunctional diguanylate cyclase/phosphodiesterase [Devosia epidermidihirudinis]|uniref:putative bifunctional diguanylate cyclase/phosphodiesterase n=1 Tax=Devosia epidermidihirudinis TaxID=1293439 RepID=UPI0006961508|nr:bifunctional diguanylate cyclase/phosphodiesterase [Devosia epidermidihirudinis]
MSVRPGAGLFSVIDRYVDRAIGAGDLAEHVREKLLRQQLAAVSRMVPTMLASSAIVSVIFAILTWGTDRFLITAALMAIINAMLINATVLTARRSGTNAPTHSAVIRVNTYALVSGILWSIVFNILPLDQGDTIRGAATIGVGGLLCISMMALVNYPQALAAFAIPLTLGVLGSVISLSSGSDIWLQSVLILAFSAMMVVATFNHASAFVAHRASESLLKEKSEIIGLLLREFEQTTSDWIWGFDESGRTNRVTSGFTTATGVGEDGLLGADFVHFLRCVTVPNDPLFAELERAVTARETFQEIELCVTAAGRECWWSITGKPALDDEGEYLGYIGTTSDITDRKLAERRITLLAHHDPMTGLLNRTKFTDQLNSCVARLERYGTPFTLMFLDLDQFKSVNDSRGHMAGDKLLIQVAKRIQGMVREVDMAARLGGDEFAIILPNDGDGERVRALAQRLIEEIKRPFVLDGDQVNIGVSIGIAIAPINGTRPDQILRNADLALYRAKADGRSVFRFFESQMDSEARERRLLEVELRDAVENNELVLYYQPLVDAQTRVPTGFEALIRWNHPIRGLVPPAEFIPIAEQSSLIVAIGDWTIEQACRTASEWPEHLTVAVNLSAKHFRRSDIASVVRRALAISGIAPQRLEIEITEGLLLENPDEVVEKLGEIRAMGVTIAMDDFGTGYSSLNYLLTFPFDKIKIDRSFVDASSNGEVARDILKAIASLGKTLKLKITAEGVETEEQADFLAEIACHQLQGFFFSRPLNNVDLSLYLLTNVPTRAAAIRAEAEAKLAIRAN